jgi:hypothetical protein
VGRQAIMGDLRGSSQEADPTPFLPHDLEACARTVLPQCLPEVRERLTATAHAFRLPLSEVIALRLVTLLNHPGESTAPGDVG